MRTVLTSLDRRGLLSPSPLLLLLVANLPACSALDDADLAPFGEVLVVVDTDLPVPQVVPRLRVDLYGHDGAAFATRDDVLPDPRDWPTSFSVFTEDDTRGRAVLVRLRAYPEGRVAESGEPEPSLTVDRLVRLRLEPGRRGRVIVPLRGACTGIPAAVVSGDARSCIDGSATASPALDLPIEDSLSREAQSSAGSYGRESCEGVPTAEGRVCMPGGAFIMGDRFYRPADETALLRTRPERLVRIARFAIDRTEVSVRRYRAAIARGFSPPIAVRATELDGPVTATREACTFSAEPRGREAYPLSCVSWVTADAFCRFEGGSLPTEAQWEYAALAVGRDRKARYPWGDAPPRCSRAVYGRSAFDASCVDDGAGPQEIGAAPGDTTPLGVRDLGGGLEEHVADAPSPFDAPCWSAAPPEGPRCTRSVGSVCKTAPTSLECRLSGDLTHVVRGGGWATFAGRMRGVRRQSMQGGAMSELVGFRCVYSAP